MFICNPLRLELRINEIDGKKGAPPRPQRATELQQPPVTTGDLSPRKASASGLEHTDRNANKSNFHTVTTPTPNKSKEDKLDPEGDAVMAEHGVKASSKRLALDMRGSKTDGEDNVTRFSTIVEILKICSTIFSNKNTVNCVLLHKFSLFYTILALFHSFFHIFTKNSNFQKMLWSPYIE